MACSRNSSTVNPLRDNWWLLTLALTRLGIGVHLRRQQSQPQQFFIQALKDGAEALVTDPLNEVPDCGVVKHRVIDGKETEPAIGDVLTDGGTQSPEGVKYAKGIVALTGGRSASWCRKALTQGLRHLDTGQERYKTTSRLERLNRELRRREKLGTVWSPHNLLALLQIRGLVNHTT